MQYIANSYNVPTIIPFKKGEYSSFEDLHLKILNYQLKH